MGDIVFSVDTSHVLTVTGFERESSSRWAEHDLLLRKPVSQFGGPGLEKLAFSIILDAALGVNPEEQLKILRKMRDTGAVAPLVIGGKPVAQNYWRLNSLKETDYIWGPDGRLQRCVTQLELTEYEEGSHTEENAVAVSYEER